MSEAAMTDQWTGCYDLSWKDAITPASFCHPAKMSRGLLRRILDHAVEQGWVQKGSTVVDPFGGISSTAIEATYRGLQVITCELEPKFVALAKENMALHARHWQRLGCPQPVILQGDSRKLCEVVKEARNVSAVVGSPPFSPLGNQPTGQGQGVRSDYREGKRIANAPETTYGITPGQLATLPPGSVEAILGSPPYEEGIGHGGTLTPIDQQKRLPIVSSSRYSSAEDNVGNQRGQTFWEASKLILEQCHQLLPPGGMAIWVVKNFVRAKREVDFTGDWRRLCEAVGFRLVCEHQAMLTRTWEEATLFEGTVTKSKERKSFFRRLAEKKGSPRIDWETVLCTTK